MNMTLFYIEFFIFGYMPLYLCVILPNASSTHLQGVITSRHGLLVTILYLKVHLYHLVKKGLLFLILKLNFDVHSLVAISHLYVFIYKLMHYT